MTDLSTVDYNVNGMAFLGAIRTFNDWLIDRSIINIIATDIKKNSESKQKMPIIKYQVFALLIVICISFTSSALENVLLDIPPRLQWDNANGYCGETSMQMIALYYGNYISQSVCRNVAGGEWLVSENDLAAIDALSFTYDEWNYNQTTPQYQKYLVWIKQHLNNCHPVIITVFIQDMSDPYYDHIIPAIGFNASTIDSYNDSDQLMFNDCYTSNYFTRTFASIWDTRSMNGNGAAYEYCIPRNVNYGVAITGIKDNNHVTQPVRLAVDSWSEPNVTKGKSPIVLNAEITIEELTPGNQYALLRYDNYLTVPSSDFSPSTASFAVYFTATGNTQALTDSFMSNAAVFYRCIAYGINDFSISGRIYCQSTGLYGVTVTASGTTQTTTTTDMQGNYTLSGLSSGGDYTVTPSQSGYSFTPASITLNNLTSNQTDQNFTANLNTYSISGGITHNGTGLVNVSISLNGSASASATTDNTGNYRFDNLAHGGTYIVTPSKTNFIFNPAQQTYEKLSTNQSDQNFTATPITYTISGTVTFNGQPLSQVNLSLTGSATVETHTDNNGQYTFSGLTPNGNFSITPNKEGFTFTPVLQSWTNLTSSQTQHFTASEIVLPSAPLLTLPINGATDQSVDPYLSWQADANSSQYTLQVANDHQFNSLVADVSDIQGIVYQLSALDYKTVYYWRVRGTNSHGSGPWSESWSFATRAPVLTASILQPAQNPTIEAGESVYFQGDDATVHTPVIYHWDFGNGRTSDQQTPGNIQYDTPGTYIASYAYATADGQYASNQALRVITVKSPIVTIPLAFIVYPYYELSNRKAAFKWETNLPACGALYLGDTPASLSVYKSFDESAARRQVVANPLATNQWHYYRVMACRDGDTLHLAIDSFYIGSQNTDTEAPYVIHYLIFPYKKKAYIFFHYNEPVLGTFYYGADPNSLTQSVTQDYGRTHWFQLDNLQENTIYYFRLLMMDMAGNISWFPSQPGLAKHTDDSTDNLFSTPSVDDTQPPVFENFQIYLHHDGKLGLNWNSDEPCRYELSIRQNDAIMGIFQDTVNYETERALVAGGLTDGETYRIHLKLTDPEGNVNQQEQDVTIIASMALAPLCDSISYQVKNGNLLIYWHSDQPANSELAWGRYAETLNESIIYNELTNDHWVAINNADPQEGLYFQARSCNNFSGSCSDWSSVVHYSATDIEEQSGIDHRAGKYLDYYTVYPNPFNTNLTIVYKLKTACAVRVEVFNTLGQVLAVLDDRYREAGEYSCHWTAYAADGRPLPSSVYFYRIVTRDETVVGKILLIK